MIKMNLKTAPLLLALLAVATLPGCGGDSKSSHLGVSAPPTSPACRTAAAKLARISARQSQAQAAHDLPALGRGVIATGAVLQQLGTRLQRSSVPSAQRHAVRAFAHELRIEGAQLGTLGRAIERRDVPTINATKARIDVTTKRVRVAAEAAGIASCGKM
jgi:hypothetical protein